MRHVIVLACAGLVVLAPALSPALAVGAPAAPDSTRYYMEENGSGAGWFAVGKSTDAQGLTTYRGSGERADVYKLKRFRLVVKPDFTPVSSLVKMSTQGQSYELISTFADGKAVTEARSAGNRMTLPESKLAGPAFVIPGQVPSAFAVLSDFLAKQDAATYKGKLQGYGPPVRVDIEVAGLGKQTVQAGPTSVEVRAFKLTIRVPPSRQLPSGQTHEITLWQQTDGSFFGFENQASHLKAYPFPSDAKIVEAPKVYPEVPVRFASGADTLAGSLMLPLPDSTRTAKPAAVVFVSGSGPSSRDEFVAGFPVFRTLALKLAAAGFASLRYDDRGVEESGGDYAQASMDVFAQDAAAAMAALRASPEIDPTRVALLGHSEGAMMAAQIASLVGQQAGQVPWCVVLMAGSTSTGREIIMAQFEHGLAQGALAPDVAARKRALQEQALAFVDGKTTWETVMAAADTDDVQTLELQKATLAGPWLRSFLNYDPKPWLQQLKVPVLVLHGELDSQLPAAHGLALRDLLKASGNQYVSYVPARGVNHIFQLAQTGEVAEYGTLKKEFAPGVAERITAFLAMRERIK